MGEARRVGQPVLGGRREDDRNGRGQVALVSGRNEYGLDPRARSQGRAHGLAFVDQGGPIAPVGPWRSEFPTEDRLRAADRGQVEPESQMAGQAEAARVGGPLAVAEDHVGPDVEFLESGHQTGGLAKREQSGNVREGKGNAQPRAGHHFERGRAGHDDGRVKPLVASVVGGVGRGHELPIGQ